MRDEDVSARVRQPCLSSAIQRSRPAGRSVGRVVASFYPHDVMSVGSSRRVALLSNWKALAHVDVGKVGGCVPLGVALLRSVANAVHMVCV